MSESVPSPYHRHNQVYPSMRPKCPVCKQPTFSPGGVHPQCSVQREEADQLLVAKAERKAAELAGEVPAPKVSQWRQPPRWTGKR